MFSVIFGGNSMCAAKVLFLVHVVPQPSLWMLSQRCALQTTCASHHASCVMPWLTIPTITGNKFPNLALLWPHKQRTKNICLVANGLFENYFSRNRLHFSWKCQLQKISTCCEMLCAVFLTAKIQNWEILANELTPTPRSGVAGWLPFSQQNFQVRMTKCPNSLHCKYIYIYINNIFHL